MRRIHHIWMALPLAVSILAGHFLADVALSAFTNSRSEGRKCCTPLRGSISTIDLSWWQENVGGGDDWIQYMAHTVTWDGGWEGGPSRALEYGRMLSGNPAAAIGWHDYAWIIDESNPGGAYFRIGTTIPHFDDRYQAYYSDIFCANLGGGQQSPPCYNWFLDGAAMAVVPTSEWESGHDRAFSGLQVLKSGSPPPFGISGDFVNNQYATFPVAGTSWPNYDGNPASVSPDMSWTSSGNNWHGEGCAPGGCPAY